MMPSPISCLVVEDEKPSQQILELYIQRIPLLSLQAVASTAAQALDYLHTGKINLLFADINLPGLSGLQLARSLPSPTAVIFTTAYEQYALSGYELNAVDYLLKPIAFDRFEKAVNRYIQYFLPQPENVKVSLATAHRPFLFIRCERKMTKLFLDEILFLEAQRNYLVIQTTEAVHKTYQSISEVEEKLPTGHFLRVHRSFIISVDRITAITASQIEIQHFSLPIGRHYRKVVLQTINHLNA